MGIRIRTDGSHMSATQAHFRALLLLLLMFVWTGVHAADENDAGPADSANTLDASDSEPVPVDEPDDPLVVGFTDYNDPLQPFNRTMFVFNDVLYRYALIPLGKGYMKVVPGPVRQGVGNMFDNIREPLNGINHLLQGEGRSAGRNLLRFVTNSTVGILGIFDPASAWLGLEEEPTNLNETLSGYGMGYGFYLVLPFIGTTDARNGVSSITEGILHPVRHIFDDDDATYILIFGNFQAFAPQADAYLELRRQSEDPYLYFRNQYLQGVMRDQEAENAPGATR